MAAAQLPNKNRLQDLRNEEELKKVISLEGLADAVMQSAK